MKTAKLFMNGRSQAVRLPSEYRFEGKEVFIHRDPISGDIILSRKPGSWQEYFVLMEKIPVPKDFLAKRDTALPQEREDLL